MINALTSVFSARVPAGPRCRPVLDAAKVHRSGREHTW